MTTKISLDNATDDVRYKLACLIKNGEMPWIEIISGNRAGAIGQAKPTKNCNFDPSKPWDDPQSRYYNRNVMWFADIWFDKKRKASRQYLRGRHSVWLPDYTGPAVYVPPTQPKPKVVACDRMGNEIKVGDFGSCVLSHHIYNGPAIYFVKVISVSDTGVVIVRSIPLKSDEESRDQKLNHDMDFVRIDDKLMKDLMLRKLSI